MYGVAAVETDGKQQSTGLLHLIVRIRFLKKMEYSQHPDRMQSVFHGFSHALNKCPPDTFCTSLRTGAGLSNPIHYPPHKKNPRRKPRDFYGVDKRCILIDSFRYPANLCCPAAPHSRQGTRSLPPHRPAGDTASRPSYRRRFSFAFPDVPRRQLLHGL